MQTVKQLFKTSLIYEENFEGGKRNTKVYEW